MKNPILLLTILFLFSLQCTPVPLNDFFGVNMDPADKVNFIIRDYSELGGVQYASGSTMNTLVYAWAEMGLNTVRIKVVNNSTKEIPRGYREDRFSFTTIEGEQYFLNKGDEYQYPRFRQIAPFTEVEFELEYPMDFWQSVGGKPETNYMGNYMLEFWKGQSQNRIQKDEIEFLTINLGGSTTLVLKSVPGSD